MWGTGENLEWRGKKKKKLSNVVFVSLLSWFLEDGLSPAGFTDLSFPSQLFLVEESLKEASDSPSPLHLLASLKNIPQNREHEKIREWEPERRECLKVSKNLLIFYIECMKSFSQQNRGELIKRDKFSDVLISGKHNMYKQQATQFLCSTYHS